MNRLFTTKVILGITLMTSIVVFVLQGGVDGVPLAQSDLEENPRNDPDPGDCVQPQTTVKKQGNTTASSSFLAEYGQWKGQWKGQKGEMEKGEGESEGSSFNFKRLFQNFKESIQGEVDKDKIKEQVETIFGKGTSLATKFSDTVTQGGEKGKQKVLDFIDKILGEE